MTEEINIRADERGCVCGIEIESNGRWYALCYTGTTTFTGEHSYLQKPYDELCDRAYKLFLAAPRLLAAAKGIRHIAEGLDDLAENWADELDALEDAIAEAEEEAQ